MSTAVVNGVSFESDAPCERHTVTWNDRTFTAGSLLLAALFAFQDWLDEHHPGLYVYVIQGAYNTGVTQSAGTHDKDGCVDILIINRKTGRRVWARGQRWLRAHHFYAWWRHTGSWLSRNLWHFHMIVAGIEGAGCPVGVFVPGQISDARGGRTGLVGHFLESAKIWRPKVYTPFPYRAWVAKKEDEMSSPKDWDKADWAAFNKNVTSDVETALTKPRGNGRGLIGTIVSAARAAGVADKVAKP